MDINTEKTDSTKVYWSQQQLSSGVDYHGWSILAKAMLMKEESPLDY